MAGTVIGLLADVNCFYAYDSRESLASQAEQALGGAVEADLQD